jgi:hypothetical protein
MNRIPARRTKRAKAVTDEDPRPRARFIGTLAREFDDVYEQLDMQLTRMANIQLQLDALRSKIRQL